MTPDGLAARRQVMWTELEAALRRAQRGQLGALSSAEIERFGVLYRRASSDLAIARRDFPEAPLATYLNGLCARAHPMLYRGRAIGTHGLWRSFVIGVPRTFRASARYVLTSLLVLLVGVVAGWLAVVLRPDLKASLVPNSLFDQMARGDIAPGVDNPGLVSGIIIQNNIRVAIACFAGGILAGLPTVAMLLANGWMLGTLGAAVHDGGYDVAFWTLIIPHGILELSIIVIAGACGLMVGHAMLAPGLLSRSDALSAAAVRACWLAIGSAALLVVAGITEGFVSPSSLPQWIKVVWGLAIAGAFYAWLLFTGRRAELRPGLSLDRVWAQDA